MVILAILRVGTCRTKNFKEKDIQNETSNGAYDVSFESYSHVKLIVTGLLVPHRRHHNLLVYRETPSLRR